MTYSIDTSEPAPDRYPAVGEHVTSLVLADTAAE